MKINLSMKLGVVQSQCDVKLTHEIIIDLIITIIIENILFINKDIHRSLI